MRRVPDWAEDEEMVTMRPHPASIMSGTTAWRQWKVPVRLTAIIRSHAAASISRKPANPSMPALVTMIPIGPKAVADLVERGVDGGPVTDVDPGTARGAALGPDLLGHRVGRLAVDVEHGDGVPRRARCWQMARPMPEPPPVTTATRLTCDSRLPCRRTSFVSPSDHSAPAGTKWCR